MRLHTERTHLLNRGMLRTDVARELYHKYYFTLFEFAKDLKHSNVQEIWVRDDSVIIRTRKENILLNCPEGDMTSALGQLILAGTENDEQDMMASLVMKIIKQKGRDPSDVVFFDIGANIGWYSLYFNKRFDGLQIHAFEPIPTTHGQMIKNMELNRSEGIHAHNFGFADKKGVTDFYVSPSLLAASSLADTVQTHDKIKIKGHIKKLDEYCEQTCLKPDFIKCDVEGAELLVFKGAERTLSDATPIVMTELLRKWSKCFGYHPNDVIGLFRRKNYSCYTIDKGSLRECGSITDETVETNFFFLHDDVHKWMV